MSKEKKNKPDTLKKPQSTLKEKRIAKKLKKSGDSLINKSSILN